MKYKVGDIVEHDGGGYVDIPSTGEIVGIEGSGYLIKVSEGDTFFFDEEEVIGKVKPRNTRYKEGDVVKILSNPYGLKVSLGTIKSALSHGYDVCFASHPQFKSGLFFRDDQLELSCPAELVVEDERYKVGDMVGVDPIYETIGDIGVITHAMEHGYRIKAVGSKAMRGLFYDDENVHGLAAVKAEATLEKVIPYIVVGGGGGGTDKKKEDKTIPKEIRDDMDGYDWG